MTKLIFRLDQNNGIYCNSIDIVGKDEIIGGHWTGTPHHTVPRFKVKQRKWEICMYTKFNKIPL